MSLLGNGLPFVREAVHGLNVFLYRLILTLSIFFIRSAVSFLRKAATVCSLNEFSVGSLKGGMFQKVYICT